MLNRISPIDCHLLLCFGEEPASLEFSVYLISQHRMSHALCNKMPEDDSVLGYCALWSRRS
jgi:hypothetical protein